MRNCRLRHERVGKPAELGRLTQSRKGAALKAHSEEDDFPKTIRAKWLYDGASTLSEAAARLRDEAEHLEELEAEGWQLEGPVLDDYGFLRTS